MTFCGGIGGESLRHQKGQNFACFPCFLLITLEFFPGFAYFQPKYLVVFLVGAIRT